VRKRRKQQDEAILESSKGGNMKYIWIKYRNRVEDIVDQRMLDDLLDQDAIEQFFRASESRWISPEVDRIRVAGGQYEGPEKRRVVSQQMVRDAKKWRTSPTEGHETGYHTGYTSISSLGTLATSVTCVSSALSS